MREVTTRAPDGTEWTVRRRWAPPTEEGRFRLYWRWMVPTRSEPVPLPGQDPVARGATALLGPGRGMAIWFVWAALAVLGGLVVIPILLTVVDVVLVAAGAVAGIASRVALRRPWTIEAIAADGRGHEYRVAGWKPSQRLVHDLAFALETGRPVPPGGSISPHRSGSGA